MERAIQLARFDGLTDVQLAWLAEQEACTGPVAKVVRRVRVGRALRAGLTDALYREVVESGDGALEQLLLEHPDLTKAQVAWLAEHGSTRRVRNTAAHRVTGR